jgi:hypothetical protein
MSHRRGTRAAAREARRVQWRRRRDPNLIPNVLTHITVGTVSLMVGALLAVALHSG